MTWSSNTKNPHTLTLPGKHTHPHTHALHGDMRKRLPFTYIKENLYTEKHRCGTYQIDKCRVIHNHTKNLCMNTQPGMGSPPSQNGRRRLSRSALSMGRGFAGSPARKALRWELLTRNQAASVCSHLTAWKPCWWEG